MRLSDIQNYDDHNEPFDPEILLRHRVDNGEALLSGYVSLTRTYSGKYLVMHTITTLFRGDDFSEAYRIYRETIGDKYHTEV